MAEQRPRPGSVAPPGGDATTRRDFLRGAAAFAGGALAGCGSARGGESVSMLVAGSLNDAILNGLAPALDVPLRVEAHGSAALARLVAEGQKHPDVVSVSDAALFDGPLDPPWHAEFATNALVLAYDPGSEGGRRIARADAWYEPLLDGAVDLGRTDPDLDPLGYRTLFALELAARHYDVPDLRERVTAREQIYPETQLLAGFETGAIDAAFAYRSMAVGRGYEYVDLPAAVDLSDPDRADRYATVSYTLPGGTTVRGDAIRYASTLRRRTDAALAAFEAHVGGGYLTDFGFVVPEAYPRYEGDVPDPIA